MAPRIHKDLKQILHPYMFVLKEGVEFPNDCLNYSLLMLHVNCLEVLGSPAMSAAARNKLLADPITMDPDPVSHVELPF